MRTKVLSSAVIGLIVVMGAPSGAQSNGDSRAAEVMAEARKALGGERQLESLKGLSLRGSFRREMNVPAGGGGGMTFVMMGGPGGGASGGSQVTGDLEIDFEQNGNYIKVESSSGMIAITRTEGFEGDRPFADVASNTPGATVRTDSPAKDPARAKAALQRTRADLARLLLGAIAGTQASFPATYTYAGQAESPDGKAHVIDVKGPDSFDARLFIDTETHLPLMLSYMAPEPRMMVRTSSRGNDTSSSDDKKPADDPKKTTVPRAPAATPEGGHTVTSSAPDQRGEMEKMRAEADATPPRIIEYRMYFSEYREVGGISLPHRIARGTAEKTTEEWDVKSYKVNPSLKPERFKVGAE